jgi:hypothetical protein
MADKCGAKTRAGGRCRKPSMPNGRCRYHGGMSTGPKVPNTRLNAFKNGIYTHQVLPEEMVLADSMRLGDIDDEIIIMRLRLRRAMAAEAKANGALELDETIERELIGLEGSKKDTKSSVRDYSGIIREFVRDIAALEMKRSELLKHAAEREDPDGDDSPIERIVVEVRHAKPSHDDDRPAS